MGSFLFSGEDVEKPISLLSGGEKARVALAKLSMDQDNFLILDEPTNHLDIDNKEVLENALIDYTGTILFVSHDRYFINRIATKVIELSEHGSKLYLGDYDYYLEKKREEEELKALQAQTEEKVPEISSGKQSFMQSKEQQKALRSIIRQIEQLEKEMEQIEAQIAQLETAMTLPENLADHQALLDLNHELEQARSQQDRILEQWETATLALEEMENE